ncbi:probable cyclic nucleotide-gated ion channel 10 [Fagus crenata]
MYMQWTTSKSLKKLENGEVLKKLEKKLEKEEELKKLEKEEEHGKRIAQISKYVRIKMKSRQKNQKEIAELWTKYEIPRKMKSEITAIIDKRFEEDEDVYVENLIPGLPVRLQSDIKRHICLNLLKQAYDDSPKEKLIIKVVEFDENSSPIDKGDDDIDSQQQQQAVPYSIARGREKWVHIAPQRYKFEDISDRNSRQLVFYKEPGAAVLE